MGLRERYAQLIEKLFNGIDAGDFDCIGKIPEHYTYMDLYALMKLSDELDNGRELYEQLLSLAVAHGRSCIEKKIQEGEKIKICFLAISAAEWPAGDLYYFLAQDSRIECYVVITPLSDRDAEARKDTYRGTKEYFVQNGYDIREIYDIEKDDCLSWSDLGGVPDIIIHLTPWIASLPQVCQLVSFPLRCIHCYLPYGIHVEDSVDGKYCSNLVYNNDFANMMWKIWTDSEKNMEGYRKYGMLEGRNVVFSGYAKMDYFYSKREWIEEEIRSIWKIPEEKKACEMRRVIIAPHHAILGYGGIKFSTFPKNAFFLLYLAKKYQDRIAFIYKPHPNLRLRAVEAGVFESYEAYDAYLREWDSLPNAKVVQESSYLEIFDTSDGMIMDSISFIAEYLYVNKPLLFLRRNGQAFNELGTKLMQAYDTAWGEDYCAIEKFLREVILNGNDEKKELRKTIWQEELDYVRINQCMASEFAYRDICSLLRNDTVDCKQHEDGENDE